jgi:non-specific serine/threonine protein kinase
MKRILALLLGIVLLMAAVPAVPALADEELSSELKEIQGQLEEYIGNMDSVKDEAEITQNTNILRECLAKLEKTSGGPAKKAIEVYCNVLMKIESQEFVDARQNMRALKLLKDNFEAAFLDGSGVNTPLFTVDELESYLQGREEEYMGHDEKAIAAYEACLAKADATKRVAAIKDRMYSDAVNLIIEGKDSDAREKLEKLKNLDYPGAEQMLNNLPTPTPTPAPTPTPKPTITLQIDRIAENRVDLTWVCSQQDIMCTLQRQNSRSTEWETVSVVRSGVSNSDSDSGLTWGEKYRYRVIAGELNLVSNVVDAQIQPTATPKPTATPTPKPTVKPTAKPTATPKITVNLWVETATEDWVALSWEVNRYDVTYELQRQVGSSKVWETIETSQGNYYGFADYPVVVGQTYRYRIVVDGQSLSEVTATVPKPTATPKPTQKITPKPTATQKPSVSISLQLNRAGINSVDLSWTCGRSGVTYEVQRKGGSSSSWTTLATISSKSYTDNSAKAGTKYTYRIVAKSATGTSNEVSVTTLQNVTPTPKNITPPPVTAKPKTWGSWSSWSTNPVSASSTRQVETKVETEYYSVTVYHYSRWKYYNTGHNQWYYSYAQYTGSNYQAGTGEWQYKTTYEPLSTNGSADGHTRYADWWWNQTTGTEQKSRQVTYYRYRDYK